MSTTDACSRMDSGRRGRAEAAQNLRRERVRTPPETTGCAHPWAVGVLATAACAPLVVAPRAMSYETVLQPAALAAAGWCGATYMRRFRNDHGHGAVMELLGAGVGAAVAAGLAHAVHEATHCQPFGWSCTGNGIFNIAAGICGAVIGSLAGCLAWSGSRGPCRFDARVFAAAMTGAYALSGLGMANLAAPSGNAT